MIAQANWQGIFPAEVLARMSLQGGDMFTSLPPAETDQDLYVFFAIFHAPSEAQSQQVLANLKIACAQHRPWVLIGEVVAAESQLDSTIASFDMQMLMGTQGRERTLSEWQSLFAGSGFSLVEMINSRSFAKLLLLRRN